jgi:hypothetical protein
MPHRMKSFLTWLTLLSLAVSGCDSGSKTAREAAPAAVADTVAVAGTAEATAVLPIVPEEVLSEWGFRTVSISSRKQSDWEAGAFGAATVRVQSIKGVERIPTWKDVAYYRFTLVEETFASEAAARSRTARLKENDPKVNNKQFPDLILRDGFSSGTRVCYITTDVSAFEEEKMPAMVAFLKTYILKKALEQDGR